MRSYSSFTVLIVGGLIVRWSADNGGISAFCPAPILTHRGDVRSRLNAGAEYQPLDGEKKINLKIDLDQPKVATNVDVSSGDKKVYCRCWLSGTFPACDGTHMKHNAATGDNVGPLILSVPKGVTKSPSKNKVEGRKTRVLWGYRATALAYIYYCVRYFTVKGIQPFAGQVTSGYALAAGLAYILASAVQGNRLSSDTYKRLNLSLIEFGAIGVLGWGLVKVAETAAGFPPLLLPPFLALIHGVKGYGYGVLGMDKSGKESIVGDFSQGVASTIAGYFAVPQNIRAAGYMAAMWMMTGLKLHKLVELVQLIGGGANGLAIFTRASRFARYAMISTVLYTLKDAADRYRLEGTTFIELNFLSAGVLAALATYSSIHTPVGGAAAVFSVFSAVNGVTSFVKKREIL